MFRFSFGTVVNVSGDCVTVKEYNFAEERDVDSDYHVNGEIEFGNIAELEDLIPGDSVVVEFIVTVERSVITVLSKESLEQPASDSILL